MDSLNRPIYIITGLMGSGKSTVANFFKLRHFEETVKSKLKVKNA